MRVARRVAALLVLATLLTLASSAVQRTRLEVQDWDCPPAPASCARPVLVGGFPFPYLSDYHGISRVGHVSLLGVLFEGDRFHGGAFWLNVALYMLATAAAWGAAKHLGRGRRPAA